MRVSRPALGTGRPEGLPHGRPKLGRHATDEKIPLVGGCPPSVPGCYSRIADLQRRGNHGPLLGGCQGVYLLAYTRQPTRRKLKMIQDSPRSKFSALVAFVLAATLPFAAIGQTYKCKTPTGGTTFSDVPCPVGMRQEQVAPRDAPAYSAPQDSNARMLTAKVAEALGSGDFGRAKGLAVTTEHWQMISNAENGLRQPTTGRTDADLRAESKNSRECKEAQRSYDVEASSIRKDGAQINAAKRMMYSACGMNEPTVIENKTVINDRPAARRTTFCTPTGGGNMVCN